MTYRVEQFQLLKKYNDELRTRLLHTYSYEVQNHYDELILQNMDRMDLLWKTMTPEERKELENL